jgi:hypothetical protein
VICPRTDAKEIAQLSGATWSGGSKAGRVGRSQASMMRTFVDEWFDWANRRKVDEMSNERQVLIEMTDSGIEFRRVELDGVRYDLDSSPGGDQWFISRHDEPELVIGSLESIAVNTRLLGVVGWDEQGTPKGDDTLALVKRVARAAGLWVCPDPGPAREVK